MISKEYGMFRLYCDCCEEPVELKFEQFDDAVDFAGKNGWIRERENNEWVNVCPECKNL